MKVIFIFIFSLLYANTFSQDTNNESWIFQNEFGIEGIEGPIKLYLDANSIKHEGNQFYSSVKIVYNKAVFLSRSNKYLTHRINKLVFNCNNKKFYIISSIDYYDDSTNKYQENNNLKSVKIFPGSTYEIIYKTYCREDAMRDSIRWKLISASTDKNKQKYHYLDTETIKFDNNVYSFWVKVESYPAELDENQNKYISYKLDKYKLNCLAGLYLFEQTNFYYEDGTHFTVDINQKWNQPIPESVAETIIKDLCK